MTFYLSYHSNKINQYIHLACIWPTLVSGLILLAHTKPLVETPSFLSSLPYGHLVVLNWSAVTTGIYMLWYMTLDMFAGTLGAALMAVCFLFANYFVMEGADVLNVHSMHVALAVQAITWTLQFIGHGVFERRQPALLDSPGQAFITAPMFVLLEILFPLGYRPDLYQRVLKQARINIKNFQATKTM
ncbi:unnamed protein product [Peronospora belbahrii]|nr:unnamed protein product [Peronospora belbahrii]